MVRFKESLILMTIKGKEQSKMDNLTGCVKKFFYLFLTFVFSHAIQPRTKEVSMPVIINKSNGSSGNNDDYKIWCVDALLLNI